MMSSRCGDAKSSHLYQARSYGPYTNGQYRSWGSMFWNASSVSWLSESGSRLLSAPAPAPASGYSMFQPNDNISIYLFCQFLLLLEKYLTEYIHIEEGTKDLLFSSFGTIRSRSISANLVLLSGRCPDALRPFHTYFLNYTWHSGNMKHQNEGCSPTSPKILFSLGREAYDKESLQ